MSTSNNRAAHPGVARAEAVFDHLRATGNFNGSRGLAALLLAAIVSAMLVVADKLVSNSNEGGLLAAWLVMWGVAFVALAFFADTARTLAVRATAGWDRLRAPPPRRTSRCTLPGLAPSMTSAS